MTIPSKKKNVIVTGQQIALLGGPLLTTYKVLTALAYKSVEDETLVAPQKDKTSTTEVEVVYWMEDNDSDFEEINKIFYLDKNDALQTLTWHKKTGGASIGSIAIDDSLIALLHHFFDDLAQTSHTQELKKLVLDCYQKGFLLKDASLKLAQKLFGRYCLTYFLPSNEHFLNFIQPYLLHEAAKTNEGKQCFLFALIANKREAIFKRKGKFYTRRGKEVLLETCILLPKLETRSVMQDAYFNTSTIIAGPSEHQYLSQLSAQYEYHNVSQPYIKKRLSWLLVQPQDEQRIITLAPFNLTPEHFLNHSAYAIKKDLIKKILGVAINIKKKQALSLKDEYLKDLSTLLNFVPNSSKDINRTTTQALSEQVKKQLKALEKTIYHHTKTLMGAQRKKVREDLHPFLSEVEILSNKLNPYGKPQERIFNVFYYLNQYGFDYLDKLHQQSMVQLKKNDANHLEQTQMFYL